MSSSPRCHGTQPLDVWGARVLAGALAAGMVTTTLACGSEGEEVGNGRERGMSSGGQGGTVGTLPGGAGAAGEGGATSTSAGGSTATGSGGGSMGFTLRAGAMGRDRVAAPQGGPTIRFGGLSSLGRVCNGAFCITGDLR